MEIIKFLQSFSNPFLDKLFQYVTMLGEEAVYILIIGIIYWCYNKKYAYKLAFVFLFNGVINGMIKNIVRAPRPIGQPGILSLRVETATSYSFPSGHTQSAAAFWTAVAIKEKRKLLYILGTIIMFSVGLSRVYLGVHWPIDAAAGIFFGVVCAFIASAIFDYSEKKQNKHLLLWLVIPSAVGLIFFHNSQDYIKAAAVVISFYIGYLVEDKYIRFQEHNVLWKQLLKLAIGLAGIVVIKSFLKKLLPEILLSDFIRYFLIGIWTTIAAPMIFKYFKLNLVNEFLHRTEASS
jgi:membrane-associated phospholipid phosphatase